MKERGLGTDESAHRDAPVEQGMGSESSALDRTVKEGGVLIFNLHPIHLLPL